MFLLIKVLWNLFIVLSNLSHGKLFWYANDSFLGNGMVVLLVRFVSLQLVTEYNKICHYF